MPGVDLGALRLAQPNARTRLLSRPHTRDVSHLVGETLDRVAVMHQHHHWCTKYTG